MSELMSLIKSATGIDLSHFAKWVKATTGLELSELLLGGIAFLLAAELIILFKRRTRKKKRIY